MKRDNSMAKKKAVVALLPAVLIGCAFCGTTDTDTACSPHLTVKGKKLLVFDGPRLPAPGIAIDGAMISGPIVMEEKRKFTEADRDRFAAGLKGKDLGRLTHNFLIVYCYAGESGDFDWFDPLPTVVNNWKLTAEAAQKAGCKGLVFDTEHYGGVPIWTYGPHLKYTKKKSLDDYQKQAKLQGSRIMEEVASVFPDIEILFLFAGTPSRVNRNRYKGLLGPFFDGFLSACAPEAELHDVCEETYGARFRGRYQRKWEEMKIKNLTATSCPDAYLKYCRVGFGIWPDHGVKQNMSFDIENFGKNYYTPEELAYTVHLALCYSDKYAWIWRGSIDWLKGRVQVYENGKKNWKPLPEAYLKALQNARLDSFRRPSFRPEENTKSKHEKKGGGYPDHKDWSDKKAFGPLWNRYTFIKDLQRTWAFRLDPHEVGIEEGWYKETYNDRDWRAIDTGEFWEDEGYWPYDGVAWYRTSFKSPKQVRKTDGSISSLFLAFGGIADEGQVYVNGTHLLTTPKGKVMWKETTLVDITDVIESEGQWNQVTVRVWDEGWIGGLWKPVKLIREK